MKKGMGCLSWLAIILLGIFLALVGLAVTFRAVKLILSGG